jgi:hypothetical protein
MPLTIGNQGIRVHIVAPFGKDCDDFTLHIYASESAVGATYRSRAPISRKRFAVRRVMGDVAQPNAAPDA